MEDIINLRLFYPMLFSTIIIISIIVGLVIVKGKDNNLFGNIFSKHTDEHIDTTGKLSKAHTEVIATLPKVYEEELHDLETDVKDVKDVQTRLIETTEDINHKLDLLIERVVALEEIRYNKDNK